MRIAHLKRGSTAAILAAVLAAVLAACESAPRGETPDQARSPRSGPGPAVWSFDDAAPGRVPLGWRIGQTNPTESLARWEVVEDPSAPSARRAFALTQTRNYNGTYNLAINDHAAFRDLDLTVRVKAVSGEEDQGGGPIWRCVDENNYYICRFNPLESNYRVYVVIDGRRKQLQSARVELEAGRWYELRVVMIGPHITCYLDEKAMLEVTDRTFAEAGRIGLWTKADAVASFDDLRVQAPAARGDT